MRHHPYSLAVHVEVVATLGDPLKPASNLYDDRSALGICVGRPQCTDTAEVMISATNAESDPATGLAKRLVVANNLYEITTSTNISFEVIFTVGIRASDRCHVCTGSVRLTHRSTEYVTPCIECTVGIEIGRAG